MRVSDMNAKQEMIQKALNFDALKTADEIAEKLGIENPAGLGFLFHQFASEEKEKMMEITDDTCFHHSLRDYLRIVEDEGFVKILEEDFMGHDAPEKCFVYMHPAGILLFVDSYTWTGKENQVNSATLYYNWKPSNDETYYQSVRSGGFALCLHGKIENRLDDALWNHPDAEHIWIGSHDAREGFRHRLSLLRDNGTFVFPWVECPWISLIHYGESGSGDVSLNSQMSLSRFQRLPAIVQKQLVVVQEHLETLMKDWNQPQKNRSVQK